jgi:long-chain fatty acid transport protein
MRPKTLLAAIAAGVLLPAAALASGYQIYEQGAAALGMAGAVTASVHDPSALFYNPAAMTRLDGTQVLVGGTLLSPRTSFAGIAPYPGYGVTEEMEPQNFFPPTVYVTHRMSDDWALGAGVNSPYGLGVEWQNPDQFTGRYIVTKARLTALNGNLSIARAFGSCSFAAGGNALFAKVLLRNRTLAPVPGGGGAQVDIAESELESDYTPGYGWNAAFSIAPAGPWKFGAFYRSKVIVDEKDGRATFRQIPTGNAPFDAAVAAGLPPNQKVATVLRFPAVWSAGVAWLPNSDWTLEADVNLTEWSLFEDLPIRFDRTPSRNTTIVEKYEDALQVRAGAEHRLPSWRYRFGYYYDQAAAPTESVSPLLPDADRHGATLGFGWSMGTDSRWTLDLYELALFVRQRSTEGVNRDGFDGEYKSFVNAAGLSVAYKW